MSLNTRVLCGDYSLQNLRSAFPPIVLFVDYRSEGVEILASCFALLTILPHALADRLLLFEKTCWPLTKVATTYPANF